MQHDDTHESHPKLKNYSYARNTPALASHCMKKWRETPKRLRHGGKKVEIGQTRIFPELQIGQKA